MILPVKALIGHSVGVDRKPIHVIIERRGTLTVEALPGQGKSAIVKDIIYWLNRAGRNVIIFDPASEYFTIAYANFANRGMCGGVNGITRLRKFAFPINFFDGMDFRGMNFTLGSSEVLFKIIHSPELAAHHKMNPEKISDMIKALPLDAAGMDAFYDKYDYVFPSKVHPQVHSSLMTWMDAALRHDTFYSPELEIKKGIRNLMPVYNHVRRGVTIFDLEMRNTEEGKAKIQLYCGIILKQIRRFIEELNPVIIFEEADKLCPHFIPGAMAMLSVHEIIRDYCLKIQKCGVFVILITQRSELIDDECEASAHQKIIGYLNKESKNYPYVKDLYNDPLFNMRQFVLVRYGRSIPFIPMEPVCLDYNHWLTMKTEASM